MEKVSRRKSKIQGKPGVIIAKCKSSADKEIIMKNKAKLKKSENCAGMYINHDKPLEQRIQESNFRTIINALGSNGLEMKGRNVVKM